MADLRDTLANQFPRLEDQAQTALDASEAVDIRKIATAWRELRTRDLPPDVMAAETAKLKKAWQRWKSAMRTRARATQMAAATGDQETVSKIQQQQAEPEEHVPAWRQAYNVINHPSAKTKEAISGIPPSPNSDQQDEQWIKWVRKEHPNVAKAADIAGFPIGLPGTLAMVGAGVAGDLMTNLSGKAEDHKPIEHIAKAAWDTIKEDTGRVGGDFLITSVPDPLNLVSFGGAPTVKTVLKQGMRVAAKTLPRAAAKVFARDLGKAFLEHQGTPMLADAMVAVARTHSVPVEAMMRVFGKNMDYAGRAGLKVAGQELAQMRHLPGAGILPEQLGRKVVDPIANAANHAWKRKFGHTYIDPSLVGGWHGVQGVQNEIAKLPHNARYVAQEGLDEFAKLLQESKSRIKPDRMKDILKRHIDLDYYPVKATTEEAGKKYKWLIDGPDGLMSSVKGAKGAELYEIKPVGDYLPLEQLNDAEKRFVAAIDKHMASRWKVLGEGKEGAQNWFTDKYFPRIYRSNLKEQFSNPAFVRGGTPGYDPTKHRGPMGGRAIGAAGKTLKGLEAEDNVYKAVASYNQKVGRRVAEREVDQQFAHWFIDESGKIPPAIKDHLTAFKQGAFRAVEKGWYDHITDLFKENVLMSVPRYHLVNVSNDAFLMYANGMTNPASIASRFNAARKVWFGKPDAVVVKVGGKEITAGALREALSKRGVGEGFGAFDILPGAADHAALKVAHLRGAGVIGAKWRADKVATAKNLAKDTAALGLRRPGMKFAETWDKMAKTSFAIDRLLKGDTIDMAVKNTYQVLFDYSSQDDLLQALRKIVPFATWQYKAAKMVPRTLARHPNAPAQVHRYMTATAGDPEGDIRDPQPEYLSEEAQTFSLGPNQRESVRKLVRGLSSVRVEALQLLNRATGMRLDPGNPVEIAKGYGMAAKIREPLTEQMSPYTELILNGNFDPMVKMLHPVAKAVIEWITERDLYTKQDMAPPSPPRVFAPGDPLALKLEQALGLPKGKLQAEASANQAAIVGRYVPQFLIPPLTTWLLNEIAQAKGAPGVPYGGYRPYSANHAERSALQQIGMGTGIPIALTTPAGHIAEQARSQDVLEAQRTGASYQPTIKRTLLREAYKAKP